MLAKATEVFWRRGYAATAMSDVYEATGLKPGSLYAAFKDKEELFRRCFEAYAAFFRRTLPTDRAGVAGDRGLAGAAGAAGGGGPGPQGLPDRQHAGRARGPFRGHARAGQRPPAGDPRFLRPPPVRWRSPGGSWRRGVAVEASRRRPGRRGDRHHGPGPRRRRPAHDRARRAGRDRARLPHT